MGPSLKKMSGLDTTIVNGRKVTFALKEELSQPTNGAKIISLETPEAGKEGEVLERAIQEVKKSVWFLADHYAKEIVREVFFIQIADQVGVEIYNFMTRNLQPRESEEMAETLSYYYHSLHDKTLWLVTSIQLESSDGINPASGKPYRGCACPDQNRFMLYPVSFTDANLWGRSLGLSLLKHTTAHEVTHLNIDEKLINMWIDSPELRWEKYIDLLVRLPGGAKTEWFNSNPRKCPTDYAAMEPAEDIPESVVAFLFKRSLLDPSRADLLLRYFREKPMEHEKPKITQFEAKFPEPPLFVLDFHEPLKELFGTPQLPDNEAKKPSIALEALRVERGIVA